MHAKGVTTDSSATASPDALVGLTLNGKYRVLELYARGGTSSIYKAEQKPLGRVVAIKLLLPATTATAEHTNDKSGTDNQFAQRFFREASILAKLQHPNIVTIFDYGTVDSGADANATPQFFMVMEFLQGNTLAQYLRERGRLPHEEAVGILKQIVQGLRVAHEAGIVHRDLKPSNLILLRDSDGEQHLKILDFGIVKILGANDAAREQADQDVTQEGVFVGSPKYMAPEQVLAGEVDQRCDLYALGVLGYELLAGVVPFVCSTTMETIVAHVNQAPTPLSLLQPAVDCPEWLDDLLLRCLAKSPADRPQTCDEVLRALRTGSHAYSASGPHMLPGTKAGPSSTTVATSRGIDRAGDDTLGGAVPATLTPRDSNANERPTPTGRTTLAKRVATFVAAAAIVGGGALALRSPTKPQATPNPEPRVTHALSASEPGAVATYRLLLTSEPTGADVHDGTTVLGKTPLDLPMDNAALRTSPRALVLKADGFETYRVESSPSQRDVVTHVVLVKVAPPSTASGVAIPRPATNTLPRVKPRPVAPTASTRADVSGAAPVVSAPRGSPGLRPLDEANPWEPKK